MNIIEKEIGFVPGRVSLAQSLLFVSWRRSTLSPTKRYILPSLALRSPLIVCQERCCGGPRGVDEWAVHVIQGMYSLAKGHARVNGQYVMRSLAWGLVSTRALSLAHCSLSWCWKCFCMSSTVVCCGSFSTLMTWWLVLITDMLGVCISKLKAWKDGIASRGPCQHEEDQPR